MTNSNDRIARIQKLAREAERAGQYFAGPAHRWIKANGSELSTLLHDLAKRIEADDEGSL